MPTPLDPPDVARVHAAVLPIISVPVRRLLRIGDKDYPTQVYFGTGSSYRFNAPDGSFGITYAGLDYLTCMAETLLRDDVRAKRPVVVYESDLKKYVIAKFRPVSRKLSLVDLTGIRVDLGLDGQIATVADYSITQAWSKAFCDHPSRPDGLYFDSRLNTNGRSVAIFNRPAIVKVLSELNRIGVVAHPKYAEFCTLPGLMVLP